VKGLNIPRLGYSPFWFLLAERAEVVLQPRLLLRFVEKGLYVYAGKGGRNDEMAGDDWGLGLFGFSILRYDATRICSAGTQKSRLDLREVSRMTE